MASSPTSHFPAASGNSRFSAPESPVPFTAWFACANDPASKKSIGGLSVFRRSLLSLERAGAARFVLIRPERGWPPPDIAASMADTDGRCLVLARAAVFDPTTIAALIRVADQNPGVTELRFKGSPTGLPAAYWIRGATPRIVTALVARIAVGEPPAYPAVEPEEGVFENVDSPAGIAAAKAALRRSLVKPTDGFFATWIDRRLSTRWSMRLAETRLSPNAITILAFAVALAGAALLAVPSPPFWSVAGALLFWLSTVLDGCDGEVARLRFQESPGGARLDLLCDNVALVAVFAAIFTHVYLESREPAVLWLALVALVGMTGSMATEYLRILNPRIESGRAAAVVVSRYDPERVRWYERLASRDFAYLLPFLALFGRLSWFAWATAIGVNAFFLGLTFYVLRTRR
jgi:phosphatidylglycerophosphate synthase